MMTMITTPIAIVLAAGLAVGPEPPSAPVPVEVVEPVVPAEVAGNDAAPATPEIAQEAGAPPASEDAPVTVSPFVPASEVDIERLRTIHGEALSHREAWATRRDLESLERAKATLMLWLIEHQRVFGSSNPATEDARTTVEAQLREVEAELESVRPAPPVAPVAPVVQDPRVARKFEVMRDPGLTAQYRSAERMAIAGYVMLGVGAGTLLLVSLPAWRLEKIALDRLDDDRLFVTDEELIERAERRRRIARVSLGVGLGSLVVGAVLTGVGLGRRAKLLRPRNVAVAPVLGAGEYGMAATLRF